MSSIYTPVEDMARGGKAMQVLREGSSGPEVRQLQERLQELGFSPGNILGFPYDDFSLYPCDFSTPTL